MRIAVLGAGSWGTTVASLLAARNDCTIWARDPELAREIYERDANSRYLPGFALPSSLKATADLEKAAHDTDLLVVGVPTHGFRAILADVRPHLRPWIPVVSLSKGFERGSLLRMTQLIQEELPGHPAAALTGPNLAQEIMAGQAAASVIATEDLAVAGALQAVMRRGVFRIYTNHDVIGCELGGALKNVVAIATGIAQGLGVGDNTRAAVVCRGLAEVTRLGVAMGGEAATFAGLAGLGDLIATCMSPLSRNRHARRAARRGQDAGGDPRRDPDRGRGRRHRLHRARAGPALQCGDARLPGGVPGPGRGDPRLRGLPGPAHSGRPRAGAGVTPRVAAMADWWPFDRSWADEMRRNWGEVLRMPAAAAQSLGLPPLGFLPGDPFGVIVDAARAWLVGKQRTIRFAGQELTMVLTDIVGAGLGPGPGHGPVRPGPPDRTGRPAGAATSSSGWRSGPGTCTCGRARARP